MHFLTEPLPAQILLVVPRGGANPRAADVVARLPWPVAAQLHLRKNELCLQHSTFTLLLPFLINFGVSFTLVGGCKQSQNHQA